MDDGGAAGRSVVPLFRKANGLNAGSATHRGFAATGGATAGRQGKSLAVRPANVFESFLTGSPIIPVSRQPNTNDINDPRTIPAQLGRL
jgi:hypothetical protein